MDEYTRDDTKSIIYDNRDHYYYEKESDWPVNIKDKW